MKRIVLPWAVALLLISGAWPAWGQAQGDETDVAAVQAAFEAGVAELNAGNLEGFLDTVHEEALSFYACGPTSGKQGREACALDWQLFFNTTTNARFETRNEQYRTIGDTGIAYGEYSLSVNYNGQGRQTVHEGRYTMTYTRVGDKWLIAMQHNTPSGDAPQPARSLGRKTP